MKIVGGWPRGALPQKTPQNQENPKESLRKTNKNHRILIKTREGGEQERRRRGEEERRRRGEEEKKGKGEEEKGERRKFKRGGGANTHTLRCPLEAGIFLYRAPRKTINEKNKKKTQCHRTEESKRGKGEEEEKGRGPPHPPPLAQNTPPGGPEKRRRREKEKRRRGEEGRAPREKGFILNLKEGHTAGRPAGPPQKQPFF